MGAPYDPTTYKERHAMGPAAKAPSRGTPARTPAPKTRDTSWHHPKLSGPRRNIFKALGKRLLNWHEDF